MISAEELLSLLSGGAGEIFDLFILDLMLPGIDGLELCRRLRRMPGVRDIPVVMLTARNDDSDIMLGLELGADLYLTKPFSPSVLVSRIRAVLRREHYHVKRRAGNEEAESIRVHDIEINLTKRQIRIDGKEHYFSTTEFAILVLLARQPGRAFPRRVIIDSVKGSEYPVTDRSIDVQIRGIRKKLGEKGELVETIHGFGYRMRDEKSDSEL